MAIITLTKNLADQLRKDLEQADVGKFKLALQKAFEKVLVPTKKPAKKK